MSDLDHDAGRGSLKLLASILAIGSLGALLATPEQRREADRRMDRIGRAAFALTAALFIYWFYRG